MLVYKVTNLINGKCYIGSTTKSLKKRKQGHYYDVKRGSQKVFHRALRKYNKDDFLWEVLCDNIDTEREMYDLEHHYITEFETFGRNGYNCTWGYDNTTTGYKFTDEQRKEHIKRITGSGNPNYGNIWNDEQRKTASNRQSKLLAKKKSLGIENPSKRPEVRKKLRDGKMGELNPLANKWLLISPEGIEHRFTGGLKRFLKEYGLSYSCMLDVIKGKKDKHKGWTIKKEG
jgi:group I intron endonuclease